MDNYGNSLDDYTQPKVYRWIERIINGLFDMITNIFSNAVSQFAPILAPLPPAFAIYIAMVEALHAPEYVGIIAAVSVELTGMATSRTALRSWNWTASRTRQTDPNLNPWVATSAAGIFFLVVIIMSLAIEIWTGASVLLYPGFVVMAITAYFSNWIAQNLTRWERDRAIELAHRDEKNGLQADLRKVKGELEEVQLVVQKSKDELAHLRAQLKDGRSRLVELTHQNDQLSSSSSSSSSGSLPTEMTRNDLIKSRQDELVRILEKEPGLKNPAIVDRLRNSGFEASISTVKRDKNSLNGQLQKEVI